MGSIQPGASPVSREPGGLAADSPNLDLLRSFAVLYVLVSHVPAVIGLSVRTGFHLGSLGFLGVMLFFVHTCLVLMLSLERQVASRGAARLHGDFFLRRAFRIYPLSAAVVLGCVGLVHLAGSAQFLAPAPPGWGMTLSNLLLIQNLTGHDSIPAPLWSLPFEIQMYLVLPALFLAVERLRDAAPRAVLGLWGGSAALVLLLWKLGISYQLVKFLPCFLPGVLAYTLRGRPRSLPWWVLFVYVAGAAFALSAAVNRGVPETVAAWPVCLGLGALIPHCRELELAWLRRAGKLIAQYSYGIYLLHGLALHLAFGVLANWPAVTQWLVFLGALVPSVWIAYHGVEHPFIEVGKRLAEKLHPRVAPVSRAQDQPVAGVS